MKTWLFWCFLILVFSFVAGIATYYKLWERIAIFATRPVFGKTWSNEVEKQKTLYSNKPVDLLFLGDSHMEQCEWQELFEGKRVVNRGIGGETTAGLLERVSTLPKSQCIFLQIGINDLLRGNSADEVFPRYCQILEALMAQHPRIVPTLVFYVRYVPEVNPEVSRLNARLIGFFEQKGLSFIDLNPILAENETLYREFSSDGIHLNARGYQAWHAAIRKLGF